MSRIIPLSQISGTNNLFPIANAGNILLDSGIGSNYAITDLCMTLFDANAAAAGAVSIRFQIGGLQVGGGGSFFPITTYAFAEVVTAGGFIMINQNVVRTFPSALLLPANCQLYLECTVFTNLTVANVLLDVSGFAY